MGLMCVFSFVLQIREHFFDTPTGIVLRSFFPLPFHEKLFDVLLCASGFFLTILGGGIGPVPILLGSEERTPEGGKRG